MHLDRPEARIYEIISRSSNLGIFKLDQCMFLIICWSSISLHTDLGVALSSCTHMRLCKQLQTKVWKVARGLLTVHRSICLQNPAIQSFCCLQSLESQRACVPYIDLAGSCRDAWMTAELELAWMLNRPRPDLLRRLTPIKAHKRLRPSLQTSS